MKMVATITVEFEGHEGIADEALDAALNRGMLGLRSGIEYGAGIGATGVIAGTVRVDVIEKGIED